MLQLAIYYVSESQRTYRHRQRVNTTATFRRCCRFNIAISLIRGKTFLQGKLGSSWDIPFNVERLSLSAVESYNIFYLTLNSSAQFHLQNTGFIINSSNYLAISHWKQVQQRQIFRNGASMCACELGRTLVLVLYYLVLTQTHCTVGTAHVIGKPIRRRHICMLYAILYCTPRLLLLTSSHLIVWPSH